MPLPKPRAGEQKDAFMHRCIVSLAEEGDGKRWPKNNQRVAICITQWSEMKNESLNLFEDKYTQSLEDRMSKYLNEDGDGGAVTSADIGVPDTDNAVASAYQNAKKKKKKKKSKLYRRTLAEYFTPVLEEAKMNTDEIIVALGGIDYFKKTFKTTAQAMQYVKTNVEKIVSTFGMTLKNIPLRAIESKLNKMYE